MVERAIKRENQHQPFVEGISSSILSAVDEELIRAFVRLDLQAMSFVVSRAVASSAFKKDFGLADLSGMPTKFRNLNEGRHYLELIMLQFMHFCSLAI